jgi:hypothetical protein
MAIYKYIALALTLGTLNLSAQDKAGTLQTATIDANYHVTLDPDLPLADFYKVDISHLSFENEAEAIKLLGVYVSGNLVSNEVKYAEKYMLIKIHKSFVPDATTAQMQEYLGQLSKPE